MNKETLCSVKELNTAPNSCVVSNTVSRTVGILGSCIAFRSNNFILQQLRSQSATRAQRERERILTCSPLSNPDFPPRRLVPLRVSSVANVCGDEIHSNPAFLSVYYGSQPTLQPYIPDPDPWNIAPHPQPANPSPRATLSRLWSTYRLLGEYRKVL